MICACCGFGIKGKSHGPYHTLSGHPDYVCNRCWNDTSLSFPDKIPDFLLPSVDIDARTFDFLAFHGLLAGSPSSNEVLHVSVFRLSQGNVTAYIGKMKVTDILMLYDLRRWNELTLRGYQRQLYNERKREIAHYLGKCPIPVIPAIFVSIREGTKFIPTDGDDTGTLEIPRRRGSIMLIDGQHRMAGFQWYFEELTKKILTEQSEIKTREMTPEVEEFLKVLRYDIPVLFLDSKTAVAVLDAEKQDKSLERKILHEDVERVVFYIVNKTQKGISPSLKDTLQFHMYRAGMRGIPSIEREKWRVDAAEIGHHLSCKGSPLEGKINLSGARGSGKPLQLNSWISSLKPLFTLETFNQLKPEEKHVFVKAYWSIIREMFEEAFDDNKTYLLLRSIGIYSLNWLAANIYEWCNTKGTLVTKDQISEFLEPLKNFNWRGREPNPSPLRGLGGRVGVQEAYKIMLGILANGGIIGAKEILEQLKAQD